MPDTGNRITPLRTARIAFELHHLTDFGMPFHPGYPIGSDAPDARGLVTAFRNRSLISLQRQNRPKAVFGAPGRTRTGTTLRSGDFKSHASTNFATGAVTGLSMEAWVGIEPAYTALQAAA